MLRISVVCAFFVVLLSSRADAGVVLQPDHAAAGSVADLSFVVSNDRPEVFTKQVQIVFPVAPRFESADAVPPTGWSSSVDMLSGTVGSVDFDAGSLRGAESAPFVITAPVPVNGDRVVFLVLQTYSDGQVTRWSVDPQKNPDDPRASPVLTIDGGVTTTVPTTTTTAVPASSESGEAGLFTPGRLFIGLGGAVMITVYMRFKRIQRRRQREEQQ